MDNDKQIRYIDIRQLRLNDDNPREIDSDMFRKLRVSLLLFDKMLRLRPIVHRDNKVVGGNMRLKSLQWIASAAREDIAGLLKGFDGWEKKTEEEKRFLLDKWAKWQKNPEVPTLSAYDFDADELEEFVAKDNISYGRWSDSILDKWSEKQLTEWGVGLTKFSVSEQPSLQSEQSSITANSTTTSEAEYCGNSADESDYEKTMQELRAKLEAGEISEDDEEYQAFVSKFEVKKTTDDCYTPTNVYEAVVEWCEKEYGIDRNKIVRPFYPNGDYTKYPYEEDSIVLDNPPFYILAEITRYYIEKGIKFFLFAPSLTLFNAGKTCTAICIGINVLYENKARVCTSFLTNLNGNVRFRSCPELYEALNKANEENNGRELVTLAKYEYPAHVATSSNIALMSKYGVEFSATKEETLKVSALDSQKEENKTIFGGGYLISNEKVNEYKQAKEMAQQQPKIWVLSEREKELIKGLG